MPLLLLSQFDNAKVRKIQHIYKRLFILFLIYFYIILRTGVHEIAILRVFSGHLSAFWAVFGCFAGEVSTFIAPEADFVDTCQK